MPWVEDVTHRIAAQTRLLFEQDSSFNAFIARQQLTRAKWALSQHAPYLPPALRKKARFHQLLSSADWARRILANWSSLPAEVQTELVYVVDSELLIRFLQQVQMIVAGFSALVKSRGINRPTQAYWHTRRLALEAYWQEQGWGVSEGLAVFLAGLDTYLLQSQASVSEPSQVLCCSDVIESMFGKYKYGLDQQVITDESVKMAAFGRPIDMEQVQAAMGGITHKYLRQAESRQPASLTKLRRAALPKNDLKTYPSS